MRNSRPTIKSIAEAVGVHPSTVSRALDPERSHMISDTITQKIRDAAIAAGLPIARDRGKIGKLKSQQTVAFLVPDISNPVFSVIVKGAEERLFDSGYVPYVVNTDNDLSRASLVIERLSGTGVGGCILASAIRCDPIIDRCLSLGLPMVVVNRTIDEGGINAVVVDGIAGARFAVEHLVENGHTRIGHIAGPLDLSTGHERYTGFKLAMEARSLALEESNIVIADAYSIDAGRRAGARLLRAQSLPSAVFVANDLLAIGLLGALEEAGLDCPGDMSVIGFNDMPLLDQLRVPLTTIHAPLREMGSEAATLLLRQIEDEDGTPYDIVLKPRLIERSSVAKLN